MISILIAFTLIHFLTSLWIKAKIESSVKHSYDKSLDALRKQRDIRISYLVNAFRVLSKRANINNGDHKELAIEIESILADIQLLGTQKQIDAAKMFAVAESRKELIEMDDLLNTFRDELRQELSLPPINGRIWNLRYNPAEK